VNSNPCQEPCPTLAEEKPGRESIPFIFRKMQIVQGITAPRNEGMVTLAGEQIVQGITAPRNEGMVTLAGDCANTGFKIRA